MYALMTLLSAGIEAGADVVSRRLGTARRRRVMQRAVPVADAGEGALRQISGHAVAGPGGPVTAPLSGEPCVWYVVTVLERYHAWRPGPLGPVRVVRHTRIAERAGGPLYVAGDTATVRVDTSGAALDLGEPVFTGFEEAPDGPLLARAAAVLGAPPRPRHRDRTLGFVVEERVVAAGDRLYAAGRIRTEQGEPVLGKPALRPLVVSRTAPASNPARDG